MFLANLLYPAANYGFYTIVYTPGGEGGGRIHQYFGSQVQHAQRNWTQSDLRFCENEVSKRFKINEKGG